MPVLSKFYGIVIRMLRTQLFDARFHAFYGDTELVVQVWPLKVIEGDAPPRVRELVLEWARQHQQELLSAWSRCLSGQPVAAIPPLR